MGFESSRAARRRLATIAATNPRVSQALAPGEFVPDNIDPTSGSASHGFRLDPSACQNGAELVQHLDVLAHDIVSTGAGGALLVAYASKTRALQMVVEAARRAGSSPLPAAVLRAAQAALITPEALAGLAVR